MPSAEQDAQAALDAMVSADRGRVEQLVGSWVPQVGSGRPGFVDGGAATTASSLESSFEQSRQQYGAVVFVTGEFVGQRDGFYIAVVPSPSTTAAEALGWCRAQELGPGECYARLVTRDSSVGSVTVYQS